MIWDLIGYEHDVDDTGVWVCHFDLSLSVIDLGIVRC